MTIETPGRPRRARRDSVVQRIAVKIPHMSVKSNNNSTVHHDSPLLQRSASTGKLSNLATPTTTEDPQQTLFPFTSVEKESHFTHYIDSFDFSVLPTDEELQQINAAKNAKYTKFLDACRFRENNYTELIGHATGIIEQLSALTVKYDTVTKETFEFQSQSDALIGEYDSYVVLNEQLKAHLQYYELLNTITRKLNNPSPNIVRRESFRRMLEQLDECIAFIEDHKDHKEYEAFMRRFKQCLTRALTLIRNYIMNNLKSIRDEIGSKTVSAKVNSVTEDALIYTRFASDGEFLREVSKELCERAAESEEYAGLLNDCYNFYFGIRLRLLQPKITDHLRTFTTEKKKTTVQFAQSNISYFTKIFKDEYELFFKFFSSDHDHALTHWFQQLAEPLYDQLRNSILREQSLNSLCELATLLDKYYEYDEAEIEFEQEQQQQQQLQDQLHSSQPRDFNEFDLGTVFEPILQDVQSRLVFRAQAYVEEKIVKYRPTSRDFQIGHRRNSQRSFILAPTVGDDNGTIAGGDDEDASMIISANNKVGDQDWYPPLHKGVALLSKIYQLVSSSVFDDLAHNIVHDCIISLRAAYRVAKSTTSTLDADLFLLKNLLMLRNQVFNFDIEYVSSETFLDFSGVGDIISKIRNGDSVFNQDGLVGLVRESVPKVVKNMIDARMELQTELRNVVHTFTEDVVKQIILPIANGRVETGDSDVKKLQENIEDAFPRLKNQVEVFINDPQVVTSLIDGIQELIIQGYEKYYHEVGHQVVDSVNVVDVDTMIAFIGQAVSKLFEEADDDGRLLETHIEDMSELSLDGGSTATTTS